MAVIRGEMDLNESIKNLVNRISLLTRLLSGDIN